MCDLFFLQLLGAQPRRCFGRANACEARLTAPVVSVQNQYNRGLLTSDEQLAVCEADGIAFFPWEPLGEGLGEPVGEIRWLLDRSPVILPIPGTSKVEHLEANMSAVR